MTQRIFDVENEKDITTREKMSKYLGWFSCGVTSAVACKIAIDEGKDVDLWYLETGAEHEDNKRFIKDCENWYKKEIKITSKGKPIFTIVPNNSELIKRWESIIGTLPKEALEAFDNKEIDRK